MTRKTPTADAVRDLALRVQERARFTAERMREAEEALNGLEDRTARRATRDRRRRQDMERRYPGLRE